MRLDLSDERMERIIGIILRTGVIASTAFVLAGGIAYLVRSGTDMPAFSLFQAEPPELTSILGVVRGVWSLDFRQWIQFGLLLLIATPIVRVLFSILAFAAQRDKTYVAITSVVAGILLYSLTGAY